MKQGKKLLICSVLGALSMTGSVYAAMPTDMTNHPTPVYELKGVTVTANRQAEDINSVPANVSVVTGSQIKAKNIQSVAQAIAMAPGMQLDQTNEGAEVRMRGYDSKNVLIMVDGQPVNNSYSGQAYLSVLPVDNISRIEVVRGGQSALYGGNAVGGVVNIITNTTRHDGVYGTVLEGYGSNNTVRQVYDVRGKKGKVTFGAFYESRSTDGWRNFMITQSATRTQPDSGTSHGSADQLQQDTNGKYIIGDRGRQSVMSESYGFQVGYNFNADQNVNYKYTHGNYSWKYNDPRMYITDGNGNMVLDGYLEAGNQYVSLTPSGSALGYLGYRNFDMHSLTYNDQKSLFHFHAGLTKYTRDTNSSMKEVDPNNGFDGAGTLSNYPSQNLTMDMNKRWKLGDHTLLLGTYYAQGKFDQTISDIKDWKNIHSAGNATDWFGGKLRTWSLYAQDKWALTNKLTAYVGGRYDHFEKYGGYYHYTDKKHNNKTDDGTFDTASYGQFSPKLSLEYEQNDSTNYYVSYGRSFNPPQLYEMYRTGLLRGIFYRGNPSLKPETTDNWELGVKKQVGDKTSITADVFKAKTKDYIYAKSYGVKDDPTSDYHKSYTNVGKADTKGFELSVTHTFSDMWSSYLNYTWQIGTINEEGDDGRGEHRNYQLPRHLFHAGVTYTNNPWTVSLDGVFTSSRNDPYNNRDPEKYTGRFGSYDPYFLLNLDSNYQFNKNISMQFSIYNVLNREFYDDELNSGRTYNVAVRYTF